MKESWKIRNEFNKIVGRYLFEGRFVAAIWDVPNKVTYLSVESEPLTKKQAKKMKKELKAALRVWQ